MQGSKGKGHEGLVKLQVGQRVCIAEQEYESCEGR